MRTHSHKQNTSWKQSNKSHKTGKHASKRSVNKKGQETAKNTALKTVKKSKTLSKQDRKNAKKLTRKLLAQNTSVKNAQEIFYQQILNSEPASGQDDMMSNTGSMASLATMASMSNLSSISDVKYITILPLAMNCDILAVANDLQHMLVDKFQADVFESSNPFLKIIKPNLGSKRGQKLIISCIDFRNNLSKNDILDVIRLTDHLIFVAEADTSSLEFSKNKAAGKKCSGNAADINTVDDIGLAILELIIADKLPNWNLLINTKNIALDQSSQINAVMENNLRTLTLKSLGRYLPSDKASLKKVAVSCRQNQIINLLRTVIESVPDQGANKHLRKLEIISKKKRKDLETIKGWFGIRKMGSRKFGVEAFI